MLNWTELLQGCEVGHGECLKLTVFVYLWVGSIFFFFSSFFFVFFSKRCDLGEVCVAYLVFIYFQTRCYLSLAILVSVAVSLVIRTIRKTRFRSLLLCLLLYLLSGKQDSGLCSCVSCCTYYQENKIPVSVAVSLVARTIRKTRFRSVLLCLLLYVLSGKQDSGLCCCVSCYTYYQENKIPVSVAVSLVVRTIRGKAILTLLLCLLLYVLSATTTTTTTYPVSFLCPSL